MMWILPVCPKCSSTKIITPEWFKDDFAWYSCRNCLHEWNALEKSKKCLQNDLK